MDNTSSFYDVEGWFARVDEQTPTSPTYRQSFLDAYTSSPRESMYENTIWPTPEKKKESTIFSIPKIRSETEEHSPAHTLSGTPFSSPKTSQKSGLLPPLKFSPPLTRPLFTCNNESPKIFLAVQLALNPVTIVCLLLAVMSQIYGNLLVASLNTGIIYLQEACQNGSTEFESRRFSDAIGETLAASTRAITKQAYASVNASLWNTQSLSHLYIKAMKDVYLAVDANGLPTDLDSMAMKAGEQVDTIMLGTSKEFAKILEPPLKIEIQDPRMNCYIDRTRSIPKASSLYAASVATFSVCAFIASVLGIASLLYGRVRCVNRIQNWLLAHYKTKLVLEVVTSQAMSVFILLAISVFAFSASQTAMIDAVVRHYVKEKDLITRPLANDWLNTVNHRLQERQDEVNKGMRAIVGEAVSNISSVFSQLQHEAAKTVATSLAAVNRSMPPIELPTALDGGFALQEVVFPRLSDESNRRVSSLKSPLEFLKPFRQAEFRSWGTAAGLIGSWILVVFVMLMTQNNYSFNGNLMRKIQTRI